MRHLIIGFGAALLGALMPAAAQAQVYYVQPQTYVVRSYYVAPSVTTYSSPVTYSYYPSTTVYSYSSPTPYYSYSAPTTYYSYSAPVYSYYSAPVVTYSAPVVSSGGVVTTRSYYGYGIFRPRGYYSESYYTPIR